MNLRSLLLHCLLLAMGCCALAAPTPVEPTQLQRGMRVQMLRDEFLLFYGRPARRAKAGEVFEVLDVRPATNQVFFGVMDGGRLVALSAPLNSVGPVKNPATKSKRIAESDALFAGLIPTLRIIVPDSAVEDLRKEPRSYVDVTIEEVGGKTYQHVGLKLKGSAGSFQGIDQRPGFSLNMDKFKGAERFHGLKRFQLNNCNQDGTALNELVSGDLARKAGVPASRCTHALVTLNGRDLGIYVLKEGFTAEFLGAFFPHGDGRLYDGGFVAEIRPDMELDRGSGKDQSRLKELVETLAEPDQAKQSERLGKVVDVDAYLRYLAVENILCHWDGYSFNRNNYRIYEDPTSHRFFFILHGMDQMFGETGWNLYKAPGAAVGAILWRSPEMQERYRKILLEIYTKVIRTVDWGSRAEEVGKRLQQALPTERAKEYEPNIAAARDKIRARMTNIRQQMEFGTLLNTLAAKGAVSLTTAPWSPQLENAEADQAVYERRKCYHLRATGEANASWRLGVALPKGKYRFEGMLKVKRVVALPAASGEGAGVRISGGTRKGQPALTGDSDWRNCVYTFETDGNEQTLVIELRARAGELWADIASLRLVRIP